VILELPIFLLLAVGVALLTYLALAGSASQPKQRGDVQTYYSDPQEERVDHMGPPDPRDHVADRVDQYWALINQSAIRHQIRQSLIQAVIHWESGGDPRAYRAEPRIKDASYGLMQILQATAKAMGWQGTDPTELYNPKLNIELGTKYLAGLVRQYNNELLALMHYNGGGRAVSRYQKGERNFPSYRYAKQVLALAEYYRERNQRLGR